MSNNSSSSNDLNNHHVCRICSDRAIGYNFSVLTCEPCKAFFRRTADKLEELQCPFNNDCDIDKITRKICRRCRLVKCLKVGMRKDWAQSDDEKKSRFENCTSLSRGCGGVKSSNISSRSSNYNCKDNFGSNLLRDFKMCNKSTATSRSFVKDNDPISSNRYSWSTLSLPTPSPSPSSSSLSMSSAKMGASFVQLPVKSSSSLKSSKSCSNLNRYGPNKQHSGLMPAPCSSLASSSSSSSSIIPTIDLMNSLQRNYYPQSNCKQQSSQDIQSILKSDCNSDWLIRFLVESHALNLPTSRPSTDQLNSESSSINQTNQSSTIRATETATCSQQPQPQSSSSRLEPNQNPCTRVGVIVDGRKLAPSPTSMISSKKTCVHPGLTCSDRQKQQPPSLTPINQTDCNLKAQVIRKILDANFAPSHLKQGCRKGFALNDLESETIDNLVNAFDFFNQPLTVNNCELTSIEVVTQLTDLYLEKLISGCRCLSSYSKLCLEDQITLVKGGFSDILTVKSHFCASMSTTSSSPRASDNCWQATNQYPDNPMRRVEDSFGNESDEGNAINLNWISDPKVICILIAIVLFNPDLPNLQAIDTIKLEQYTYIYLLKRYLESQCGSSCRARTEHFNLIFSIEKIMVTRMERTSHSSND